MARTCQEVTAVLTGRHALGHRVSPASVSSVAGAERLDLPRLREADDVEVLRIARSRRILLARQKRHADRMQTGDELAVLSEYFERGIPGHRVFTAMLSATYGESVIWTPRRAIGEPEGPFGMTYTFGPASTRQALPHRVGSAELFVAPASSSFAE